MIGSLQALEVIKMITKDESSFSGKMLMMDGGLGQFRTIRLRGRQSTCAVCGNAPTITELQDYVQFCGSGPIDKVSYTMPFYDGK
jgi:adenylyltransferase/sulfurtransferase